MNGFKRAVDAVIAQCDYDSAASEVRNAQVKWAHAKGKHGKGSREAASAEAALDRSLVNARSAWRKLKRFGNEAVGNRREPVKGRH